MTGFDGIHAARTCAPPPATVARPMADLGRRAVEVLTTPIASPGLPPIALAVPVAVLLRASCGPHEPPAARAPDA